MKILLRILSLSVLLCCAPVRAALPVDLTALKFAAYMATLDAKITLYSYAYKAAGIGCAGLAAFYKLLGTGGLA